MRKLIFSNLVFGTFALTVLASASASLAFAHEGHEMECNEINLNAVHADIQSMNEGEAKTAAMKEMQMAEDMMAKKDMKGCMAHMHNAMDATEK